MEAELPPETWRLIGRGPRITWAPDDEAAELAGRGDGFDAGADRSANVVRAGAEAVPHAR